MFSPSKASLRAPLVLLSVSLLSIWPGAASFGIEAPAPPESSIPELAEILHAARENAPDLIEQDFLQKESHQRLKQANSAYYPKLDLITNLGYRKDFRKDGEDTDNLGLTYSANLHRPLYHWGAIEARIEQARIDNDNNALNYRNNVRSIERRIRADYLHLILDNLALENELKRKALLEALSTDDQINFEAGKISELQFRDKQLSLQSSLLRISQIKKSQQRIAERFRLYAGWDQTVGTTISAIPRLKLEETEQWLTQQLELIRGDSSWLHTNFESEKKQNEIRYQEEAITRIKAKQLPLINASASASQNQTNTSTQNNVDTFSVFAGIQISWNIFDGFQTRNEKIEATTKLRRMEMQLNQLSAELKLQAMEMLDHLLFEVRDLAIQESMFESETIQLSNKEADAQEGRISAQALNREKHRLGLSELALHQRRANLILSINDYQNLVTPIRQ